MTEDLRVIYGQAMNDCLKPWYTDDCKKCRREFIRCLHEYLAKFN